MTERRKYRLRNGMTAIIDDDGFGMIEGAMQVTGWNTAADTDQAYFLGGIMGDGYDAVMIISAPLGDDALYRYIPLNEEQDMAENTDGFRTISYYNGYPIEDLSDTRIFELVSKEQAALKALNDVPQGAAVNSHKARVEANISALMDAVNKRHAG